MNLMLLKRIRDFLIPKVSEEKFLRIVSPATGLTGNDRPVAAFGTRVFAHDGDKVSEIQGVTKIIIEYPLDDVIRATIECFNVKPPKVIYAIITEEVELESDG